MDGGDDRSYASRLMYVMLFAVAMGYFEAVVVVYLREIFYPEGFTLPLKTIPPRLMVIELCREASTVVMLAVVAALAAKKFWERFGWFIILFGVWDIFYYIFLKVTLNWPATFTDWDILFLIPLPWFGPVIAPVLIAVVMTVVGISITKLCRDGYDFRPTKPGWILSIAGTAVLLYSFMCDLEAGWCGKMPRPYSYPLLVVGLVLYCAAYGHVRREVKRRGKL